MKRISRSASGLLSLLIIYSAGYCYAQGLDSSVSFSAMTPASIEALPSTPSVEIDDSAQAGKAEARDMLGETRLTPPGINWNNILMEQRERLRETLPLPENSGTELSYKTLSHRNYEAWDTAWFYERIALAAARASSPIEPAVDSAVGQRIIPDFEISVTEKKETPPPAQPSRAVVSRIDGRLIARETSAGEWAVPFGALPPARFSVSSSVLRASDAGNSRVPSVERTTLGIEAKARLFEFLDNHMTLIQNVESREGWKETYRTTFSSRMVFQSTATFNHPFGQTRLHAGQENSAPAGEDFSALVRQANTFSFSNRFNEQIQADASLRVMAASGARNPAASVTVKPFAPGSEILKNVEVTTKYEEVNQVSAAVNERDVLSFFLRNQYRGWKAHYNYRNSISTGPLDLHDLEQRHRIRLDYGLQYKDIDVSPYASVDLAFKDDTAQDKELRVGTDLGRDLEQRYRMNMQLFCGLAKKAGVLNPGGLVPLTGMGISINFSSGLYLKGSLEMTAPEGNARPAAFGDVELSQTF